MKTISKYPLHWNLTELYKGVDDPKIESDMSKLSKLSADFEKKHRGRVGLYAPSKIKNFLEEYEGIQKKIYLLSAFAENLFSLDSGNPKINSLHQRFDLASTEMNSHFIFVDLELASHPKLANLSKDALLKKYRIIFEKLLEQKQHFLTHAEESILNIESIAARSGWANLYDKIMSGAKYEIKIKGGVLVGQEQALHLLYSTNRATRKAAAQGFARGLEKNAAVITHINNMLLLGKMQRDKIRKYEYPEQSRHLDNGLTKSSVDALTKATQANFKLVSRYYEIKRRLMKLKNLYDFDRYAPVTMNMLKRGASDKQEKYAYDSAVEIVHKAFSDFDSEFGSMFMKIIKAGHVDVLPKDGKRGGAHCSYMPKPHLPYVFLNYLGSTRDVKTLAHEMGHAIHDMFASSQPMLVAFAPLALAETASVFGEMIVFENLLRRKKTWEEKIIFIVEKVDEIIATVFRQMSMFMFEQKTHNYIKEHGEVPYQKFCDFWIETQSKMHGRSVELTEDYGLGWAYIPHMIHTPFYVYAYAFGNLLVLSMYEKFKNGDKEFVEKYKAFLSYGGSKTPQQAVDIFGFNLESGEFWQSGFKLFERLVRDLENLI